MTSPADADDTVVWPASRDRNERLALVLDRYMSELENTGLPPDVDRLLREHPDLADDIRSYVESLQMLHQMTTGLRPASTQSEETPAASAAAKRLGDYEIVREIGRGGMGVVYEARQISLNRQVALKVLPFAAMLDQRQIARFRTEAQAAAQLHHPNIVPVHAVGQERGVHYFAMQFIPGQSLEAAIAELRGAASPGGGAAAPTSRPDAARPVLQRDRETVETAFSTRVSTRSGAYCRSVARLMLQAAEALHHAHLYGVVHRDVKPSNLLLDRDGKLWVTDFGLARVQTDSGVTMSGDLVGTVRYMSPEQAAGNGIVVDARTDVYALGATLYELLTLTPVHRGDARQEILRQIESVEPTAPRSLNQAVPVDLETITMRALAKSRDERYLSAQDFADDLRRFLAGEPTRARRPTVMDRSVKWALRHRRSVAVALAFLLVLTGVSVGAAVMLVREQARTAANLTRAEEHYKQARQAVDFYGGMMATQLAGVPGAEPVRRAMLDYSLDYYQQFIARSVDDPQLRTDTAGALHKAASMAEWLGDRQEALRLCRQAIELLESQAETSIDRRRSEIQMDLGGAYSTLGLLLAAEGDGEAAERAYAKAIAVQRRLADQLPGQAEPERTLAQTYSNLGLLQSQLGDKERARSSLGASIRHLEELLAQFPTDLRLRHDLAISFNNLSYVDRHADWARAEESCRQALDVLRRLVEIDDGQAYRSDMALTWNNLGAILTHRDDLAGACEAHRRAIAIQRQLTRQASAVVAYRRDLAVSLNNLGQALQRIGAAEEAVAAFNEAKEIGLQLTADYPQELVFRSLLAATENNRASALEAEGRLDDALAAYETAIEHQRNAHDQAPQIAEFREFLSTHYANYGRTLRAAGRPLEAAHAAVQRRELWPSDGERLGQIAVELGESAAQLRAADPDRQDDVGWIEREAAATLELAAGAGCDLAPLRRSPALDFLQENDIWNRLERSD